MRSVIELHDKFLAYVTTCFSNTSLFHRVCEECVGIRIWVYRPTHHHGVRQQNLTLSLACISSITDI